MGLTVEDGTGVAGANSYVTTAEARTYATERGLSFPADESGLEALLIKATDYLEGAPRGSWKGTKTYVDPTVATLSWPRTGVIIDDVQFASDQIPVRLKQAQIQMAFELQTSDPGAVLEGSAVKREKVDVIETEYFQSASGRYDQIPVFPKVNALLAPFVKFGSFYRLVRI